MIQKKVDRSKKKKIVKETFKEPIFYEPGTIKGENIYFKPDTYNRLKPPDKEE